MDAGTLELEKDFGKAEFQQELNRWFESRGVMAELRSHLRHLMVTALQSTQLGAKPTEGSSPKAQALNLIVAEYLFRHGCHYTLSVLTSEVPTLANFEPGAALRGGRRPGAERRLSEGVCFRDNEIEEILNALGMSSREEEVALVKGRYLERGNETSLLQLFLQAVVGMARKLQIRQELESLSAGGGERLLSKKWSTKVADVLLAERMPPEEVTAVEEAIFRITEREVNRIVEEERRGEMQKLKNRERGIQEYLRKREDDMLSRLAEAERELTSRKSVINQELTERQEHLTKMAVEWSRKHEEMVRLSKSFHGIESENRRLQQRVKELEEERGRLRTEGEAQRRAVEGLRGELGCLRERLKEESELNGVLSERIQALMGREKAEGSVRQEAANQETGRASAEEIPLLWSRRESNRGHSGEGEARGKPKELAVKVEGVSPSEVDGDSSSSEEVSLSPSSEEIIEGVRRKLRDLEAETERINQSYLEYKLRWISVDSSSESSSCRSGKSGKTPGNVSERAVVTETKFCQTVVEDTLSKIQKLEEKKEENEFERALKKKLEEATPRMPAMRTPTKRQLQNRDFFLRSRQLLHELERQNLDVQATSPSVAESPSPSSGGEDSRSLRGKRSPERSVLLTPLRTASFYCNDPDAEKPEKDNPKNQPAEPPDKLPKDDRDCLALLEEARIRSPQTSARKPLRQQMLLSESEKDADERLSSPASPVSGKLSDGRRSENESFW